MTANEKYRRYSEAWGVYNQLQGAKGTGKGQWKYSYGKDEDCVFFGITKDRY